MFLILVFSILFLYCKIHCEKELFCVMTWHDLSRLSLIEVPNLWQFRDIDFVLTGQLKVSYSAYVCVVFLLKYCGGNYNLSKMGGLLTKPELYLPCSLRALIENKGEWTYLILDILSYNLNGKSTHYSTTV